MSKQSQVLEHLKKHKSITPVDAYKLYGSMRLSGIIYNLREQYKIETIDEKTEDRFGNSVCYARYVYKGKIKTVNAT